MAFHKGFFAQQTFEAVSVREVGLICNNIALFPYCIECFLKDFIFKRKLGLGHRDVLRGSPSTQNFLLYQSLPPL